VADVAAVKAVELRNPLAVGVLLEADDGARHHVNDLVGRRHAPLDDTWREGRSPRIGDVTAMSPRCTRTCPRRSR
jgi:hypothetical protein